MLRMDLVHVVRHKVLVEGRTQRAVARELGLARVTGRKYLDQAAPVRKLEARPRPRPVWDAVADRVEALLAESVRWTGGKQRLTATRLHELLLTEGHHVGVTVVKDAVAEWKRQRREVFVPLTYRPGDLAEVDFFEVLVDVDGTRRKAWLFLMRLMYSGRDFAWIYERQDQISFLDGHVRAFAHFEGVPARVAYDNLRAAVVRILVGGARTLTPRFEALASHYLLEACFCRPGVGREGTRILHPRKRFGQRSIDYRHYLAELARKPQAVRQVLPDLLRDLGDPFSAIWDQLHGAHGPREAARLFAKVLGQLDTYGAAVMVPALTRALATGTPLLLAVTPARSTPACVALDAVPAPLRDIAVTSGCAADYDGWLLGGVA